jgi:hypothetical protein
MGEIDELAQEFTILGVVYVAGALMITFLWAHLVIHNPFDREMWTFGAQRWFIDIGPLQFWWGR